jgi:predicted phage terminase large subunit-like protein
VSGPLGNISLDEEFLTAALNSAPASERAKLIALIEELRKRHEREFAQENFLAFVQKVWPDFIYGRHHARMAQEFEKVVSGENKRLIINLGPRHTKSEFGSYLLPAWFLGKYPKKKIIQCSHTSELAVGFGRKVRNLVSNPLYQDVFPGVELQTDSKAAGRWNTSAGGNYFAIGVSGAVTGIGADLLIIDDPHSEQEAAIAASNPEIYDKVYEWYTSGPRQRLQPGGGIIIIQCMTGDTPVALASGGGRFLKDIIVGDEVATYSNGELTSAKVLNHQSNGIDKVYKIRTTSGVIVRANERHPFLVEDKGVRKWIRLKNLKPGMLLVVMKDVIDHQDHSKRLVYADLVKQLKATIKETQMRRTESLNITASIKGYFVRLMGVMSPHTVMSYVNHIITKQTGNQERIDQPPKPITQTELKVGTVLLLKTLIKCLMNRVGNALYVKSFHQPTIQEHIGTVSYVLTIAMILVKSVRYCVTTAISLLGTQKQKEQLLQLQNTSVFTVEPITEITYDGEEEVFDIQIEGTENFIANGVVSHNTRWSKRDLTGQVKQKELAGGGDKWRVVELPAILPSGKPLWPEFWSIEELESTRNAIDVSKWQAQYQQNPTSEEGAIVKREWWQRWEKETPPPTDFVLQTWDTAFEKHNRADYSACITWGVFYHPDENGVSQANIIMLDAKRDRMEFPRLKEVVLEEYKYWEPDALIIEKKASGAPLIYELRAMGVPVSDFTPTRGNDKISRLNAVADIFASGRVWVPNTRWADEVMEEVASFPAGQHDDYVDCVSMGMARFRKGGFLSLRLDSNEMNEEFTPRQAAYY